jgi:hypothetical protein
VKRVATALLTALLLSACGTTVQYQGAATTPQGSVDGLNAPALGGTTGGTSAGTGGTSLGTTTGVSAPGTTGGVVAVPSSAPTGSGTAGGTTGVVPGGPESGRGFTKTTISIGVGTADDYNTFAGGFGLAGVTYSGDPNVWMNAVKDAINKRGGLMGRRIVLVKHNYNTAQLLNDPAGANQAACATWTQDKPVFAVLLAGMIVEDTILSCLGKAGVPLVYPGASLDYPLHYQAAYNRFPLFFNLAQMVGERLDRLAIDRLVARGFFQPWDTTAGKPGTATANPVKIGLLGFDDSDGAAQQASRTRELARHGLKPDSVINCPRALTSKIQCLQSAGLRFATNRVTHVFGSDTTFMNNAQSQGYHPRYYVANSTAAFAANVGAAQLTGAMGEGYVPVYDVETSEFPRDLSPAATTCKAIMKAAGEATTDRATLALQMSVCDEFFFTEAAMKLAGSVTAGALRSGFESLGARQASALAFQSFLGPRDHASAPSLRDLVYRPELGRFAYASTTDYR